MLDRFDDRTLEIATVVVVVVIALVILCYLAIFFNPQIALNPFKPPTATPLATPISSLSEPTWTPLPTDTPAPTATSTPTWTPSPTPTDMPTPLPPTATPTPTPTATNTPRPTKPPPPPAPTATPTPWPYFYSEDSEETGVGPDCTRTWVEGWVLGANGLPEAGVQLRVGDDQGWRTDIWTDINGYYFWEFAQGPKAGKWFVRVFKGGEARSMQFWWETSAGCESRYSVQHLRVTWRHR